MKDTKVYHKILDVAEELIQKQGFHAFSYKDVSLQVGIKTSSIHYHFPTKNDLAVKVIERHLIMVQELINSVIGKEISPKAKMNALVEGISAATFEQERKMCLGGMLAIDALCLDDTILREVEQFFNMLEGVVAAILVEAKQRNVLRLQSEPMELARNLVSLIEGTILLSRLFNKKQRMIEIKSFIGQLIGE